MTQSARAFLLTRPERRYFAILGKRSRCRTSRLCKRPAGVLTDFNWWRILFGPSSPDSGRISRHRFHEHATWAVAVDVAANRRSQQPTQKQDREKPPEVARSESPGARPAARRTPLSTVGQLLGRAAQQQLPAGPQEVFSFPLRSGSLLQTPVSGRLSSTRAAASRSPANMATTERACSYPVANRNVGARP